jgi:hypothetical protein
VLRDTEQGSPHRRETDCCYTGSNGKMEAICDDALHGFFPKAQAALRSSYGCKSMQGRGFVVQSRPCGPSLRPKLGPHDGAGRAV